MGGYFLKQRNFSLISETYICFSEVLLRWNAALGENMREERLVALWQWGHYLSVQGLDSLDEWKRDRDIPARSLDPKF